MTKKKPRIETQLIHAGEPRPLICGAVSLPIFQSSTFEYAGQDSYHDLKYIRLNNTPNHVAVGEKLAAVEGAEAALATASGMAAISAVLLGLLKSGDRLLAQECLYGGTHDFITQDLPSFGIEVDFIDADRPETWQAKLTPTTRLIYVETITNPLMQVGDLLAVPAFARENGLVSVIDNTFASPFNFRPPEHGYDLSLHSGTKYLNGHSDIVAGAVVGKNDLVERITRTLNHLGGALDPHACFLLHRGLKTLAVRMARQNDSALLIARFLEGHPKVVRVNYPGLESHPAFERARHLFAGASGMISFEVDGGVAAADRFIDACTLPISAPSLGGVESLITRPATTSHAGMAPEERRRLGISDSLIRLSVGLEAAEDLIEDFTQALRAA
ncbi:MAG: aminotransferase class I/II-fold pyridoxal phosphate-dependent enzyme [Desulfobacterales bacterium]|nr:aminotransferase class I/II-fold pyridoxal phosphate-dependent enzyme [Desulfobacterales bacterium]